MQKQNNNNTKKGKRWKTKVREAVAGYGKREALTSSLLPPPPPAPSVAYLQEHFIRGACAPVAWPVHLRTFIRVTDDDSAKMAPHVCHMIVS